MNRKSEFVKANKQTLEKGLDYIELVRKYIEWLEQKLEKAESDLKALNNKYKSVGTPQSCHDCSDQCADYLLCLSAKE